MPSIAVLYSGTDDPSQADKYETFIQAEEVAVCLIEAGMEAILHEFSWPPVSLEKNLRKNPPDAVFNMVEEIDGSEAAQYKAVNWFEQQGLAYTGNTAAALRLSFDKIAVKKALADTHVSIPAFYSTSAQSPNPPQDLKYIVKSLDTHGSVGIFADNVVNGIEAAQAKIEACCKQYGGEWFAELYIEGREITVSVLDIHGTPTVLPMVEAHFDNFGEAMPRIIGYKAKWDTDSFEYENTNEFFFDAEKDPTLASRLEAQCLEIWNALGMRGYARFDFRVDADTAYLIDVTPRPSLAKNSFFYAAGLKAGISQKDVVVALIKSAIFHAQAGQADVKRTA